MTDAACQDSTAAVRGTLAAPIALAWFAGCAPGEIPTVPGPEDAELDARLVGNVVASQNGITSYSLKGGSTTIVRPSGEGRGAVHCLDGPDALGRVAFIENFMMEDRFALKTITLDGAEERELFQRSGAPLRDDAVGDDLALSPVGGLVAFVEEVDHVQMRDPDAYLGRGRLAIWDLTTGEPLATGVEAALDDRLSWFPDGKRLAYSAMVPRKEARPLLRRYVGEEEAFGRRYLGWPDVPVVFAYDVRDGTSEALHVGTRPAVAPDGTTLFVRGFQSAWRLVDLAEQTSAHLEAPGGTWPGAVAFLSPELMLYWAWPTAGAETGYTTGNSPLVGPKPNRTLKVVDLESGTFRTVVASIDPRTAVGFGLFEH